MLSHFISTNRAQVIRRSRAAHAQRTAPDHSDAEVARGIPLFVDQLINAACARDAGGHGIDSAVIHRSDPLEPDFTISQIVLDYGDVRLAITQLAAEQSAEITEADIAQLNACLNDAIAQSVIEYTRMRLRSG